LKNALDWTVGAGSLSRKPITVLDVAPPGRGGSVRHALDLVFKALDADVVHRPLPVSRADRDAGGEIASPEITEGLYAIVSELAGRAAGVAAA
jgi:NAD(P)H-dependent FMN reductase